MAGYPLWAGDGQRVYGGVRQTQVVGFRYDTVHRWWAALRKGRHTQQVFLLGYGYDETLTV